MAAPNKDDPKKNPEPNRAGTDINKNVESTTKIGGGSEQRLNDDGSEITKEQQEQEEQDRKDYEARMKYASGLNPDEPKFIESESDWSSVNALVADGYAQVCAEQRGTQVKNYIELTPEGVSAVQAYNSKED